MNEITFIVSMTSIMLLFALFVAWLAWNLSSREPSKKSPKVEYFEQCLNQETQALPEDVPLSKGDKVVTWLWICVNLIILTSTIFNYQMREVHTLTTNGVIIFIIIASLGSLTLNISKIINQSGRKTYWLSRLPFDGKW